MKSCHLLLLSLALSCSAQKLKVSLHITSMCKDTRRFFVEQLVPAYDALKHHIDIEYIPWGKAKYDPLGQAVCQFGPKDCAANKIQMCTLYSIGPDQDKQMEYMNCEFSTLASTLGDLRCAVQNGVTAEEVENCFNSEIGNQLVKDAGDKALPLKIQFVPSIVYNDVYDPDVSMSAFTDFMGTTCAILKLYGIATCQ